MFGSNFCTGVCRKYLSQKVPQFNGGFTFIGLLLIIAIMSVALLGVSEVWNIARKREKEQELLFVGHEFRKAIKLYCIRGPRGSQIQTYPMRLEDMLKDPRFPNTRRYLRKIYTDPLTGNNDWGLLKNPNGSIYGVYSLAEGETVKRARFDVADISFEGGANYSDWKFTYIPTAAASGTAAASSQNKVN
jgi:type II secretory pathway pseudopilin PulG